MTDPVAAGLYVTPRELFTVERALLKAMAEMEERLTAKIDNGHAALETKIDEANRTHDSVHSEMRRRADDRHSTLDNALAGLLRTEEVQAAEEAGRSAVYRQALALLRAVNEFRWLIAMIVAVILLLTQDLHITVQ
jgi:hypothetical protein